MKKDNHDSVQHIFDQCLKYLSYKSRTEMEMVQYMERKACDEHVIAEVMEKLIHYHYIDDREYLKNYCYSNKHYHYWGKIKMRYDLKKRGLNPDILLELDDFFSDEEERACCVLQFKKAEKQYNREMSCKRRQKIYVFLQRKGFSNSLITEVLESFFDTQEQLEECEEYKKNRQEEALKHFEKYLRMYTRKGYEGRELENRIIRGMMGRGYTYALIKEIIREKKEEAW